MQVDHAVRLGRDLAGRTVVAIERDGQPGCLPWSSLIESRELSRLSLTAADRDAFEMAWADLSAGAAEAVSAAVAHISADSDLLDRLGWRALEGDRLGPCLPGARSRVFALGGNYVGHMVNMMRKSRPNITAADVLADRASGLPPWGFTVTSGILTGYGTPVVPPAETRFLDYEGEFALVIANGGRNLAPESLSFCGLSAFSDFSIRDGAMGQPFVPDRGPLSWTLSKNFETGKVLGPWMTWAQEAQVSPHVQCLVNGEVRQDTSIDEIIYPVAEAVSYLSRFMAIRPGDVFASGCAAGAAAESGSDSERYLHPGDVVTVRVDGVGDLVNSIGQC